MKYKQIFVLMIAFLVSSAFQSPLKNHLIFKTISGHVIKVEKGKIWYDHKMIYMLKYADDILYQSKYNRLIEDHGSTFLFVAMAGNPNLDMLDVYTITPTQATKSVNSMISEIKDYDKDGFLEFGGHDLTEHHPNSDSAYYIPSTYYEIRNGKINKDLSLTKSEEIKLNGVYLQATKQLDNNGYCCRVIRAPTKRKN